MKERVWLGQIGIGKSDAFGARQGQSKEDVAKVVIWNGNVIPLQIGCGKPLGIGFSLLEIICSCPRMFLKPLCSWNLGGFEIGKFRAKRGNFAYFLFLLNSFSSLVFNFFSPFLWHVSNFLRPSILSIFMPSCFHYPILAQKCFKMLQIALSCHFDT